jgi:fibronectin type 3 domain-containing protein
MATPRPAAPTGLTATPNGRAISLIWSPNAEPGVDGYHLYRSETSGVDHELLFAGLIEGTAYQDNAVEDGKTYYYIVTAQADGDESGVGGEAQAKADFPENAARGWESLR